jgi:hypothetical protein
MSCPPCAKRKKTCPLAWAELYFSKHLPTKDCHAIYNSLNRARHDVGDIPLTPTPTSLGAMLCGIGDDFISWPTSLDSLETRKPISRPTPTGAEESLDATLYEGHDSDTSLVSACCPETWTHLSSILTDPTQDVDWDLLTSPLPLFEVHLPPPPLLNVSDFKGHGIRECSFGWRLMHDVWDTFRGLLHVAQKHLDVSIVRMNRNYTENLYKG